MDHVSGPLFIFIHKSYYINFPEERQETTDYIAEWNKDSQIDFNNVLESRCVLF